MIASPFPSRHRLQGRLAHLKLRALERIEFEKSRFIYIFYGNAPDFTAFT
jgi:hypothetical protein